MFWIKMYTLPFLFYTIMHGSTQNQLFKRFIEISKADIWSKLSKRSVFVGGNKKINLSETILSRHYQFNNINVIRSSELLYVALKCHCADSIKYLYETSLIYEFQKNASDRDQNKNRNNQKPISVLSDIEKINLFLEEFNSNLILTITILFKMNDSLANLKTQEPFFFKH